jgi:CheY-like chemotaxis protein
MRNILIVEDDRNMCEIYKDIFMETGGKYEIVFAFNVEEAVERMGSKKVDLVVLDMMMEPISGAYLYLKLRQDKNLKTKKIPVIIVTVINETKLGRFKKGENTFIFEKPIEKSAFLRKVEEMIV